MFTEFAIMLFIAPYNDIDYTSRITPDIILTEKQCKKVLSNYKFHNKRILEGFKSVKCVRYLYGDDGRILDMKIID